MECLAQSTEPVGGADSIAMSLSVTRRAGQLFDALSRTRHTGVTFGTVCQIHVSWRIVRHIVRHYCPESRQRDICHAVDGGTLSADRPGVALGQADAPGSAALSARGVAREGQHHPA